MISLNYTLGIRGPVQWAYGRVVIADQANAIYRFAISGKTGTLKGTTKLDFGEPPNGYVRSFWIRESVVAVAFFCPATNGGFKLYNYPAGSHAIKTVTGFGIPSGITVSPAQP